MTKFPSPLRCPAFPHNPSWRVLGKGVNIGQPIGGPSNPGLAVGLMLKGQTKHPRLCAWDFPVMLQYESCGSLGHMVFAYGCLFWVDYLLNQLGWTFNRLVQCLRDSQNSKIVISGIHVNHSGRFLEKVSTLANPLEVHPIWL